ncbi:MAG: hypothetical protein KJ077_10410 [Anaerolineae bacterium]|nr:hypothetical protein [Anaerolineae bacterium]
MSKSQKFILAILSLILLCVCLAFIPVLFFNIAVPGEVQKQVEVQVTVAPPSPPTPTPVPIATEAAEVATDATIPGLEAADVIVSLEERDFTCTQAEKHEAGYYSWTCKEEAGDYSVEVNICGETLRTVDYISVYTLDFGTNGELLSLILGFVATAPYEGAQPGEARVWVENNYRGNESHEATFGGVKYALYGEPSARSLTMGVFKW